MLAAINAPGKSLEYIAYLFKYDSVHGRFGGTVKVADGALLINGSAPHPTPLVNQPAG